MSWLWGHRVRLQPLLTCAASCGERGGPSGRKPARRGGTETAGALCACGSGGSAHRSGQISSHILPRCSGRASRLQRRGGVSGLVGSHPPCAFKPSTPLSRRWEAHWTPLPAQLSSSVPIFLPFPMCKGLFSGHPCPIRAPLPYVPLLHFKLWVVPCSSLLWAGTMCPVPPRPRGSHRTTPSLSPYSVFP